MGSQGTCQKGSRCDISPVIKMILGVGSLAGRLCCSQVELKLQNQVAAAVTADYLDKALKLVSKQSVFIGRAREPDYESFKGYQSFQTWLWESV